MNYLDYSFWIMLSVFVSYVAFIWIRYDVQKSISDSFYRLIEDPKMPNAIGQSLFTFFCWGFAFPAIIIGVDLTDNVLMFLAGSGICFVGAAAAFKGDKMTHNVHMIGAYSGVAFSQLAIAFLFKMYYVNIVFILIAVLAQVFRKKLNYNHVWWQEIAAFVSMLYVYAVKLYGLFA